MPRYRPEPIHRHDSTPRTGVLLVNSLGTPPHPPPPHCVPTLKQFLSDPRVVEIPPPGVVADPPRHHPEHPTQSLGQKYASIWTDGARPCFYHGAPGRCSPVISPGRPRRARRRLRDALRRALDRRHLDAMRARGCTRILVVPMYPQCSASTTATVVDEVGRSLARRWRNQPEMRFVRNFHDDPTTSTPGEERASTGRSTSPSTCC